MITDIYKDSTYSQLSTYALDRIREDTFHISLPDNKPELIAYIEKQTANLMKVIETDETFNKVEFLISNEDLAPIIAKDVYNSYDYSSWYLHDIDVKLIDLLDALSTQGWFTQDEINIYRKLLVCLKHTVLYRMDHDYYFNTMKYNTNLLVKPKDLLETEETGLYEIIFANPRKLRDIEKKILIDRVLSSSLSFKERYYEEIVTTGLNTDTNVQMLALLELSRELSKLGDSLFHSTKAFRESQEMFMTIHSYLLSDLDLCSLEDGLVNNFHETVELGTQYFGSLNKLSQSLQVDNDLIKSKIVSSVLLDDNTYLTSDGIVVDFSNNCIKVPKLVETTKNIMDEEIIDGILVETHVIDTVTYSSIEMECQELIEDFITPDGMVISTDGIKPPKIGAKEDLIISNLLNMKDFNSIVVMNKLFKISLTLKDENIQQLQAKERIIENRQNLQIAIDEFEGSFPVPLNPLSPESPIVQANKMSLEASYTLTEKITKFSLAIKVDIDLINESISKQAYIYEETAKLDREINQTGGRYPVQDILAKTSIITEETSLTRVSLQQSLNEVNLIGKQIIATVNDALKVVQQTAKLPEYLSTSPSGQLGSILSALKSSKSPILLLLTVLLSVACKLSSSECAIGSLITTLKSLPQTFEKLAHSAKKMEKNAKDELAQLNGIKADYQVGIAISCSEMGCKELMLKEVEIQASSVEGTLKGLHPKHPEMGIAKAGVWQQTMEEMAYAIKKNTKDDLLSENGSLALLVQEEFETMTQILKSEAKGVLKTEGCSPMQIPTSLPKIMLPNIKDILLSLVPKIKLSNIGSTKICKD